MSKIILPFGEKDLTTMSFFLKNGWKAHTTRNFTLYYFTTIMKGLVEDIFMDKFADVVCSLKQFSASGVDKSILIFCQSTFEEFWQSYGFDEFGMAEKRR